MRASDFESKQVELLQQINNTSKIPTVRELAVHFDVAPATMHSWLSKLSEGELVTWESGRHRSLRLTRKGTRFLKSSLSAQLSS